MLAKCSMNIPVVGIPNMSGGTDFLPDCFYDSSPESFWICLPHLQKLQGGSAVAASVSGFPIGEVLTSHAYVQVTQVVTYSDEMFKRPQHIVKGI